MYVTAMFFLSFVLLSIMISGKILVLVDPNTTPVLGLSLLFPKYYLIIIFHSEFPKSLLHYSLGVDPLFHTILLTVSQK